MMLNRLIELRKNAGFTQEQVADYIGVARSTYAMYEQGNREMDYQLLVKLADLYKVSLDYIFGRTDNPIHYESYSDDEIEFLVRAINLYKEIKNKYY